MRVRFFSLFIVLFCAFFFHSCIDDVINPNINLTASLDINKTILKTTVNNASDGFTAVFKDLYKTDEARIAFIRCFVEDARYLDDLSGYIYCYDTNFVNIAHPVLKDYIGNNHYDDTDSKGKYFVHEMKDSIKLKGYGFISHYWKNTATNTDEEKIAYIKLINKSPYCIGSGFLLSYHLFWLLDSTSLKKEMIRNTVHYTAKGLASVAKDLIKDSTEYVKFLKVYMDSIRYFNDGSGYFFVDDLNYFNIVFPTQKNLEGTNLYDYVDPRGNYPVRLMVDLLKREDNGFIEYYYINPINNNTEKKLVYIERIAGTSLFIGSGFYSGAGK